MGSIYVVHRRRFAVNGEAMQQRQCGPEIDRIIILTPRRTRQLLRILQFPESLHLDLQCSMRFNSRSASTHAPEKKSQVVSVEFLTLSNTNVVLFSRQRNNHTRHLGLGIQTGCSTGRHLILSQNLSNLISEIRKWIVHMQCAMMYTDNLDTWTVDRLDNSES